MRLIKQTVLYFKEGNSDKVYEIDLCDVGNDRYVVNFRYGRRGAALKEGSKTPVPVSLAEAERLFDALSLEKTDKGYTTSASGEPVAPRARQHSGGGFSLAMVPPVGTEWMSWPDSPRKAVLRRLHHAIVGGGATSKPWKLSRVIWKAGQYAITEAAPHIIQLYPKGDILYQYVCTWSLVRTGSDLAIPALQKVYKEHPDALVKKIAGAGLFALLSGPAREQHAAGYQQQLPEALQAAISSPSVNDLQRGLYGQTTAPYTWLDALYLLTWDKRWLRPVVKEFIVQLPLQPNYFKQIRSVYKLAELLDDFEMTGLLACQLERVDEMFSHSIPLKDKDTELDLDDLDDFINPHVELKKPDSQVAYSNRTRWYLHRRIRRRLLMLGNTGHTDYVKLATAVLIAYDRGKDFREPFSQTESTWTGRSYTNTEYRYPQNAHLVLLHYLLSGEHPDLQLIGGKVWQMKQTAGASSRKSGSASYPGGGQPAAGGGLLQKIIGLFGKKKPAYTPVPAPPPAPAAQTIRSEKGKNGTPFLSLWDELPQSYVQLLVEAQLEEIHEFAASSLLAHPAFSQLKEKFDKEVYKKLLLSPWSIPHDLGYQWTLERYASQSPEADLVSAMLQSPHATTREKGMEWAEAHRDAYLQDSQFIADLLFLRDGGIRLWAQDLIDKGNLNSTLRQAVVGKAIAHLMGLRASTPQLEAYVAGGKDSLFKLFEPELRQAPLTIIADLLLHAETPVLLFGLQLLTINEQPVTTSLLSRPLLTGLLQHPHEAVRATGIELLGSLSSADLAHYKHEILAACLSVFPNVRQGIATVIGRLAQQDHAFGVEAASMLMPYLLRKEQLVGLHADISRLLCNELSDYLQDANKETALNLLYGNYAAAQNVGVTILEKYTQPDQLTLPQVIALGNHENVVVRGWSWRFYEQQAPRIRTEKETAVKLLDSKWEDTRQAAMQFFRAHFAESDWTPEALIALADSVKPDVEAFGRELITRYFISEQGHYYLLRLSQHPSEKMQLFATNYLERYAGGDVEKIASLEFYFRSVLTRVNKGRVAKNRIFHFLLTEGRRSPALATIVSTILADISATAAIGDKAKCIEILLQLQAQYAVETPLKLKTIETRTVPEPSNPLS